MSLPKKLLAVIVDVDAEIEADWNAWYNTKHVPDILACPGLRRCARYVAAGTEGQRTYIALYEIDNLDVMETPEFKKARGWEHFTGRVRSKVYLFDRLFAMG